MLRRSFLFHNYRSQKVTDRSTVVVAKKEIQFDHIAIDASGLVGVGLRLAKTVQQETRRHKEVARHVAQAIFSALGRFHANKSLGIFMDGSEILWKAQKTRQSNLTKKGESRLARLPGSALIQVVEDRLAKMIPDGRQYPREVVFSGSSCGGSVEQKISAWALDLASRENFKSVSESLLLIGGTELFLNSLALTPFYNITTVVQNNNDFKQLNIQQIIDWLDCGGKAAEGDNAFLAKVRTDAVFIYTLCHGASVSEMGAVSGLTFSDLFGTYLTNVSSSTPLFLFEEQGNILKLNLINLLDLLKGSSKTRVNTSSLSPRASSVAADYLELALQTHAMFCNGILHDPRFVCRDIDNHAPTIGVLISHLMSVVNLEGATTFIMSNKDTIGVKKHTSITGSGKKTMNDTKIKSTISTANDDTVNTPTDDKEGSKDVTKDTCETFTPQETTKYIAARRPLTSSINMKVTPNDVDSSLDSSTQTDLQISRRSSYRRVDTTSLSSAASIEELQISLNRIRDVDNGPLTAAEYTVLSQPTAVGVESAVLQNIGKTLKSEVAKRLVATESINEAASEVRKILSCGMRQTKTLHFCPSYCWLQNEKTKVWNFVYIDLGERSIKMETRSRRNEEAVGEKITLAVAKDGPVYFSISEGWVPVPEFPFSKEVGKIGSISSSSSSSNVNNAHEGTSNITTAEATSSTSTQVKDRRVVSVLTWNVMFDRYSGMPTPLGMPGIDWCTLKRYPVIAKLIEQEDADVVGLQEVEPEFWDYLSALPWVRERYVLSCNRDGPAVNPWGVLMLIHVRMKITNITHLNIPAWSGHLNLMPVITVDLPHGPVQVASMHLLAPYTKSHENARAGQDNALKQRLLQTISGDCICMGDYNDWPSNEFFMEPESRYIDTWLAIMPKSNLGKTMDETNEFAKLKIEEIFFGRADKVFLRSNKLKPINAHLVGTRSVNVEMGNNDAPAYLFPSDHYGIKMCFSY